MYMTPHLRRGEDSEEDHSRLWHPWQATAPPASPLFWVLWDPACILIIYTHTERHGKTSINDYVGLLCGFWPTTAWNGK